MNSTLSGPVWGTPFYKIQYLIILFNNTVYRTFIELHYIRTDELKLSILNLSLIVRASSNGGRMVLP